MSVTPALRSQGRLHYRARQSGPTRLNTAARAEGASPPSCGRLLASTNGVGASAGGPTAGCATSASANCSARSGEPLRRVVLGDGRPPGLQAGDRHAERAAGHVVQAHVVEEVHRLGVAAVLPADAGL